MILPLPIHCRLLLPILIFCRTHSVLAQYPKVVGSESESSITSPKYTWELGWRSFLGSRLKSARYSSSWYIGTSTPAPPGRLTLLLFAGSSVDCIFLQEWRLPCGIFSSHQFWLNVAFKGIKVFFPKKNSSSILWFFLKLKSFWFFSQKNPTFKVEETFLRELDIIW